MTMNLFNIISILSIAFCSSLSFAAQITGYKYNKSTTELTLNINYIGGCATHNFSLAFVDDCDEQNQTSARLLDSGWNDVCDTTQGQATLSVYLNNESLGCQPTKLFIFQDGRRAPLEVKIK